MIENMSPANDNGAENIPVLRQLAGIIFVALGLITLLACAGGVLFMDRRSPDEVGLMAAIVGTALTFVILIAGYMMMTTYLRYAEARRKAMSSRMDQDASKHGGDDGALFP